MCVCVCACMCARVCVFVRLPSVVRVLVRVVWACALPVRRLRVIVIATGKKTKKVNAIRGPKKLSMSMDVDFNAIHF